jgi:hypothetical protein
MKTRTSEAGDEPDETAAALDADSDPENGKARVLDLLGSLDWDEEYDYKAERSRS